jgi:N-acetylglucosaminyl-diphospho-decaprenol L-rhamnosyltransferase
VPHNPDNPEVAIVMINLNQADYTNQCLASIRQAPPITPYEIILVDNGSTDGSGTWIADHYPEVRLVRSPLNIGYGPGNNLGIRASQGEFVLLLNNDTLVTPGMIDQCVAFLMAHPEAGAVGGNLLNADGSFQSGYMDHHTLWRVFLDITKLGHLGRVYFPSHPRGNAIKVVDWICSAFLLCRREALDEVGLFDEEYFIYSDETAFQYQMAQAGWKIYYLPDVETVHFGGKALNPWRRRRLVYRGYLIFFREHRGAYQSFLLRAMLILACTLKLIFWALAWPVPCWRERAGHELRSNFEILRMCLKPKIEAP